MAGAGIESDNSHTESDLVLLREHVDAYYVNDETGRMLGVNEPWNLRQAPRFYFGQSRQGNVWRLRHDLPTTLIEILDRLASLAPISSNLHALPSCVDAARTALEMYGPIIGEYVGPAYCFPDKIAEANGILRVTRENAEIVSDTFPGLLEELDAGSQPCVIAAKDGAAVSVCRSVRLGKRVMVAGVETLPEFRGRGYASAVVAGWARAVKATGFIPLYSTSWDNLASQGVARRLGLILYAVDYHCD